MSAIECLSDAQLERLADLIADRLAERAAGEMIDAAELAKRINRSRDFVYEHATSLGAVKLGDGPRPRLAFRWPQVLDHLAETEQPTQASSPPRARRQRARRAPAELLPIRGRS
jgi:hypothetical protein